MLGDDKNVLVSTCIILLCVQPVASCYGVYDLLATAVALSNTGLISVSYFCRPSPVSIASCFFKLRWFSQQRRHQPIFWDPLQQRLAAAVHDEGEEDETRGDEADDDDW
eukprot:1193669-Prorocentrum_minimum.AAC.2